MERSGAFMPFPVSAGRERVKKPVTQDDVMDNGPRFSCAAQIFMYSCYLQVRHLLKSSDYLK